MTYWKRCGIALLAFTLNAACTLVGPATWAHDDEDHTHETPVKVPAGITYAPTAVPDRIVLTWAEDPTTTQSVTWRTDTSVETAIVEYATAEDGPLFVNHTQEMAAKFETLETDLGVAKYHSVTLSGLVPNTKYVYRVGDGVNWSEWAHFITASDQADPFSFVYVGDAQNDLKSHWSRLVRQAYSDAPRAAFLLHAGDLVNRADSDAEWGEWFYAQGFIPRSTPCVAVPGNHEQSKIANEETGEVTRRLTNHWERVFEFPSNGPESSRESVYWMDYQGVRFIGLDSNNEVESQAVWLEKVLQDNPQNWTVITFHHPIYSSKRGRDNSELRGLWQPIFDKYKVDLVLNGHDHTYARTGLMAHGSEKNVPSGMRAQSEIAGTVYVVSVSGPKMYELGREPYMERVAEDTQLYQIITVDGDELRYVARTAVGRPYDGFTLTKRDGKPNQLVENVPDTPERVRPEADVAEAEPVKRDARQVPVVTSSLRLTNPEAKDQDDLCVWRDKQSPDRSVIIASDKSANRLFVYDLEGNLTQSIEVSKPGNIDLRYDVPFQGEQIDLVAVNQREDGFKLRLYRVDRETRELNSIDHGGIATGPNYGGCLYRSAVDDRLYFFTTSKESGCEQIELSETVNGFYTGKKVRHLDVGMSEGAVADDQLGLVYVATETEGVWRFEAEPTGQPKGTLILQVGDNGIQGDLEGLALSHDDNQIRYLTVSDQGSNTFHVLPMVGGSSTYRFSIENAEQTDGIEVVTDSFGPQFPQGFFACHSNHEESCPILITPLPRIMNVLGTR
ncbi:phytase [Rhodopirellula sp. P2]|uniref:phytase n=1 Tax=Rhodopirellula sp. P2 TaxID=2127060 RepID=UPI002367E6FA|nr:phytase [Rhodopirellula sp. P2]WDQ15211.1 phytase [Rhodopirellula sp. P2]